MYKSVFTDAKTLEEANEMARSICASTFAAGIGCTQPNALLCIEISRMMNVPVPVVLANICLDPQGKNGRYAWRGPFTCALIARDGRFEAPLTYEYRGEVANGDRECRAVGVRGGRTFEGYWVKLADVSEEVFHANDTWARNPDKMLCFHAAAEFARQHCPEVLFGLLGSVTAETTRLPAPEPVEPVLTPPAAAVQEVAGAAATAAASAGAGNAGGTAGGSAGKDPEPEKPRAERRNARRAKHPVSDAQAQAQAGAAVAAAGAVAEAQPATESAVAAAGTADEPLTEEPPASTADALGVQAHDDAGEAGAPAPLFIQAASGESLVVLRDDDDDKDRPMVSEALSRARSFIPPPTAPRPNF